jgi:hypothetical protein
MKTSEKLSLAGMAAVLITVGFFCATILTPIPTIATGDAPYGMFPYDSAYAAQSTADQTLLAAPGTDRAWRVTGVWYHITTAEANANVQVEDAAGTPIVMISIPLDTKGSESFISFGTGVLCSTNSAVQVDFSGSTGEAAFVINAHQERTN